MKYKASAIVAILTISLTIQPATQTLPPVHNGIPQPILESQPLPRFNFDPLIKYAPLASSVATLGYGLYKHDKSFCTVGALGILPSWIWPKALISSLRIPDITAQWPALLATAGTVGIGMYTQNSKIVALTPLAGIAFYRHRGEPWGSNSQIIAAKVLPIYETAMKQLETGNTAQITTSNKDFDEYYAKEGAKFIGIQTGIRCGLFSLVHELSNGSKIAIRYLNDGSFTYEGINEETLGRISKDPNENFILEKFNNFKKDYSTYQSAPNYTSKSLFVGGIIGIGAASKLGITFPGERILNTLFGFTK